MTRPASLIYGPRDPASAQLHAHEFADEHPSGVMVAYSPSAAAFFAVDQESGGWADGHGGEPDWEGIFQIRAFDTSAELRWTYQGAGLGGAVILTERDPGEPGKPTAFDSLQTRVLWGRQVPLPGLRSGWSALSTARVGTLHVPLPHEGKKAIAGLRVREYAHTDEHGNTSIVDERLIGLEWIG